MFLRRSSIILLLFAVTFCAAQNTKENADFKLAFNLFRDKLYDLSLEQFKQFISTYPSSPQSIESKFYIALADRALKKSDDARAAFQNFALTYPDHPKAPDAWWNIGEMYGEEKKFGDAASAFERIKVFQPKSTLAPKALLTASEYFERAGDNDNAKRCLRSLVSDYPTDELVTAAHAQLGTLFLKENNLIAARSELLLVTESGGDKELIAEASLQLASVAESSGRPAEAEQLYHAIIDGKKTEVSTATLAQAKLQLARFYFSSGRQAEAIEGLQNLAGDSLKLPQGILQQSLQALGNGYYSVREYKKAADAYERSLLHSADSSLIVTALFGAGQSYDALKEYRKSFAAFSAAVEKPASASEERYALLRAATLASSLKDFETAVRYYTKCLDLFPNDEEAPDILFRIAELHRVNLKEPQKAIDLYTSFLVRYPNDEECDDATFSLGLAYEALQETGEAMKAYNKLIDIYPASKFTAEAIEKKNYLQNYKSPDKEQTVKQLALLIGDLILEKEKSELAMRLGDIYLNVLQDFPQAAIQFGKAESVGKDTLEREEAAFKRTVALYRQTEIDSSSTQASIEALTIFLKEYPAGRFSDEAAYKRFLLQAKKGEAKAKAGLADRFLKERPSSIFTAKVLLALGNAQKEMGMMNESIETYKRIANEYPIQPEADEATAQLGIQLAHLGRSDTASIVFNDYLRAYPKGVFTADILYENGMLSAREDKPLGAVTLFEQLRTKYFYSARAVDCVEMLAESYQKTNQFDKAVALYRRQLNRLSSPLHASSKGKLQVVFQLGKTYDAAKDTVDARKEYLDLVDEDAHSPEASEAFARLAAFEKQAGKIDASIQFFEKSIEAKRTAVNTAQLASLYFANNDYQKAIADYESLAGLSDADSSMLRSARVNVIIALYRSDKSKEAERKIAEYLNLYGSDRNALAEFEFEQAMTLYRGEESDRALEILRMFPTKYDSTEMLPQACFWIGKILETKELPDSALKQYDFVMRTFPRSSILPKVYLALGNIYFFKENYDEAVKYYRLIVDKPDLSSDILPFAMSNLIETYKELALYDGALELTRSFIEKYPNDESILDKKVDLGVLYQKLGYYDQAIVQLEALLETTNKDFESEIRYYLGESYYYKGDYEQAILEFLKVPYLITKKTKIDWTPNSYYMSAQAYEKMGKFDQALNMYQQIIDKPGIDPAFKTAAQKEINRVKSGIKKDSQ
ncbi:MAG: tetratricopeptide repeat protein [Bacteroidota bacterium]